MAIVHSLRFAALTAGLFLCPGPGGAAASVIARPAYHRVSVDGDRLRVSTTWRVPEGGTHHQFARPLPAGAELGPGVAPIVGRDGRVVGLTVEEEHRDLLAFEVSVPWVDGSELVPLAIPRGPGWQRVEVDGDFRLFPNTTPPTPLHGTGYYAPDEIHLADRIRIDRRLDGRHPVGALYLPGSVLAEAGGVPGQLESGAGRRAGLGLAAGGAFFAGILALTVVFRRHGSVVEAEQAEAYLDQEFRALSETTDRPSGSPGEADP